MRKTMSRLKSQKISWAVGVSLIVLSGGCEKSTMNELAQVRKSEPISSKLCIGMEFESVKKILDDLQLLLVEDTSASAVISSNGMRRFLIGVNSKGDALYLSFTKDANQPLTISKIFWHKDFVTDRTKPKASRLDEYQSITEIDLTESDLKSISSQPDSPRLKDPFGADTGKD